MNLTAASIPNVYRDASSAAVSVSAIPELAQSVLKKQGREYIRKAEFHSKINTTLTYAHDYLLSKKGME